MATKKNSQVMTSAELPEEIEIVKEAIIPEEEPKTELPKELPFQSEQEALDTAVNGFVQHEAVNYLTKYHGYAIIAVTDNGYKLVK